jgi:hypothetical protein
MHFRFEHEFDIDPKTYWEIFFDEEYNKELYKRLRMSERQVLEQKDDGKTIRRSIRLTPADDVPAMFKSVIKDTGYTEHDVYYRDRSSMDVTIEPAMMKNKFDFKATYSVAPVGPGNDRCRRVFEGDCKVSVMVIGGQIEKYIVENVRSSYDTATAVTREWIAKRKAQPTT